LALAQVVYSVEWAADPCVGEAITNVLSDELRKRGIPFELGFSESKTGEAALSEEYKAENPEIYRCLVVEDTFGEKAQEALDSILQNRRKELKAEALRIAKLKGIVRTRDQAEAYADSLTDSFGW